RAKLLPVLPAPFCSQTRRSPSLPCSRITTGAFSAPPLLGTAGKYEIWIGCPSASERSVSILTCPDWARTAGELSSSDAATSAAARSVARKFEDVGIMVPLSVEGGAIDDDGRRHLPAACSRGGQTCGKCTDFSLRGPSGGVNPRAGPRRDPRRHGSVCADRANWGKLGWGRLPPSPNGGVRPHLAARLGRSLALPTSRLRRYTKAFDPADDRSRCAPDPCTPQRAFS